MQTTNTLQLINTQTSIPQSIATMTLAEFLAIPAVHCQRDLTHRVRGLKKRLASLEAPHQLVHIGIYLCDVDGYKQGDMVVLDGNGRQFVWKNHSMDVQLPTALFATMYGLKSKTDAKKIYDMLDSQAAVEKTHEKITGFYRELGFPPFVTKNLQTGRIVKMLEYCSYGRPYSKPNPGYNKDHLVILQDFEKQLFAIDAIGFTKPSVYQGTIATALLMALKKHEDNPAKLALLTTAMERMRDVEIGASKRNTGTDGVTKIILEYKANDIFPSGFGTNAKELPVQLDFILYCLEKFMKNEMVTKYVRPNGREGRGNRKNIYLSYF